MDLKKRIVRNSLLAILAVVGINLLVLYFLGFPPMALLQIKKYFLLLILLVGGFGIQIGLYTYLRHASIMCSITATASGSVSAVSMLLCCSHYLANILPFISISTFSFFTRYTLQILLVGLVANLIGILIMVIKIRKLEGRRWKAN